jgi:2-oxoglutarate ferredoxin oxidoreductase subunit beta
MRKKGFSVIEALTPCPTYYGRRNSQKSAVEALNWQTENTISANKAAKMSPEEMNGKIVIGELVNRDKPEYVSEYQKFVERLNHKVTA